MSAVETYSDIKPRTPRALLRRIALQVVSRPADLNWLARPRVHVLVLHHVFPDEEDGFGGLLELLAKDHELISYSDAVRRVISGNITNPAIAFSFDDGLASCVKAAEILEAFGTRACFFVCPGIVGSEGSAAARVAEERFGLPTEKLMTWQDVDRLAARGHEIGSHTMGHPAMASLSAASVRAEVEESMSEIGRHTEPPRHFAWPYGTFKHFSAEAVSAVFDAGFVSCASTVRGAHVSAPDHRRNLCLRRENVVAAWPIRHTAWFLARSARKASPADNEWPTAWALPEPGPAHSSAI